MTIGGEMHALVWEGPNQMAVRTMPVPQPAAGEVLVQVRAAGICGSELEGYVGQMKNRTPPLVMGHEFAGSIAAVGRGVDEALVGRHAAVNPLIACGSCEQCDTGHPNLCGERIVVGIGKPGGFADYTCVPADSLLLLPDGMPAEAGALVEPLANVIHAINLGWRQGVPERVLLIGAGSLGLLAVQAAKLLGAIDVVVVDLSDERLATAAKLGATHTVNNRDTTGELDRLLPHGADVVIDCVGASVTKQQAVRHARSGGTVVLVGLHDDETPLSSHELIRREITVTGSYTYAGRDLTRAVEYLASGAVRYDGWTTSYPLADGPSCFEQLVRNPGGFTKIFLNAGADT